MSASPGDAGKQAALTVDSSRRRAGWAMALAAGPAMSGAMFCTVAGGGSGWTDTAGWLAGGLSLNAVGFWLLTRRAAAGRRAFAAASNAGAGMQDAARAYLGGVQAALPWLVGGAWVGSVGMAAGGGWWPGTATAAAMAMIAASLPTSRGLGAFVQRSVG